MNLPSNRRIENAVFLLKKAIEERKTLPQICNEYNKSKDYVKDYISKRADDHLESDYISLEEHGELKSLHEEYKENLEEIKKEELVKRNKEGANNKDERDEMDESNVGGSPEEVAYDAYQDDSFDERSVGEPVRESDEYITLQHGFGLGGPEGAQVPKISCYRYHIMLRDEDDLIGELSREEMEKIYNLYSNIDGAGLTQRSLSRHFDVLTLKDLKRLLRAFGITKQSAPVPPHVIEEKSPEKVVDLIHKNKEDHILKKLEEEKAKKVEAKLREKEKEVIDLKERVNSWENALEKSGLDVEDMGSFYIEKKEVNEEKAFVLYLSDQHVGAHTEEDSIYENEYNADEFERRMAVTLQRIYEEYEIHGRFDELIICNLGDSVDGFNEETTRGGHRLTQNMGNAEQFTCFVETMVNFFGSIHKYDMANKVSYYAVTNDNHAGDFGFTVNKSIQYILNLKYPEMVVGIIEKSLDYIEYGKHALILGHGKDKQHNRSGFPLTLDAKTENYFNDYITQHAILKPYISVVMGDLHQSSVQYAKRFRYKRVLSMYGASGYIHTNFGSGKAGVEYDIIEKDTNNVRGGIVEFNK